MTLPIHYVCVFRRCIEGWRATVEAVGIDVTEPELIEALEAVHDLVVLRTPVSKAYTITYRTESL